MGSRLKAQLKEFSCRSDASAIKSPAGSGTNITGAGDCWRFQELITEMEFIQ